MEAGFALSWLINNGDATLKIKDLGCISVFYSIKLKYLGNYIVEYFEVFSSTPGFPVPVRGVLVLSCLRIF